MVAGRIEIVPVAGLPLVQPGDDLAALIIAALAEADVKPRERDILVLAQKVVSKAEGRHVDLATVTPSPRARRLAAEVDKDARLVELILSESEEVVRHRPGVLVVAHKLGYVMANAGIDRSNVDQDGDTECVLLLPRDPDKTCAALKARLEAQYGVALAVIVNDSAGRAWRLGTMGFALGSAGLPALDDRVGTPDLFGRPLEVTQVALADEVAAAASLVMGQADEGRPLALVRGVAWSGPENPARALLRPKNEDLFR